MKKIFFILLVGIMIISLCSCNNKKEDSTNNSLEQNDSVRKDTNTTSDSIKENDKSLDINNQEEVSTESSFVDTDISIDGLPSIDSIISFQSLDNKFGALIKSEYFTAYDDEFDTTREYSDFSIDLNIGQNKNRTEGTISKILSLSKTESIVKGIVVGDPMNKVLSTFFNENNEQSSHNYYGDIKILYGDEDLYNNCAYIIYKDDNPSIIKYVGESIVLIFTIDNNNNISQIEVINTAI